MAKPIIHLVIPIFNRSEVGLTVLIIGENFARSADAQTLGMSWEYETTWRSDKMLEFELDVTNDAAVVGIVVLNDLNSFTYSNTSEVYMLPIDDTIRKVEK